MTEEKKEPTNPKFVREDLCQARINTVAEKFEGVKNQIQGLRTEMKALLGSSILTIVLIILQFMRELR